jgi:hypothetical protein
LVEAVRKLPASSTACVLLAGRLTDEVKKLGVSKRPLAHLWR